MREAIVKVPHPDFGTLKMQNVAPRLSDTSGMVRHVGPEPGEHIDDVLTNVLNLLPEALADWRERGSSEGMTDRGPDSSTSFLPLTDAAERLGISRFELREAIAKAVVPARRDNLGDWRVDLTGASDLSHKTKEVEPDPQVLNGCPV